MANQSSDQVVFAVTGTTANAVEPISLSDTDLKEREHLQEWVLEHPEIIGPDVMIVTSEFDHWSSSSGPQKERPDVIGLGKDGRIVVVELKRGAAPDTVDMQALKYAAMASRFTPDLLAEYHTKFSNHRMPSGGAALTEAEALSKLETHSNVGLPPEQLINPRIVLLAESFPKSVTATAVWLNERGVDLTLMRYQAYRLPPDNVMLTVSQLYPVRDVAEFEVAPHSSAKAQPAAMPEIEWTTGDLTELLPIANATTLAVMDLCALSPTLWIGANDAYARAGVITRSGMGQLGGFGGTVKARFKRSNPPYERQWSPDGTNQACYRMDADLASTWLELRGEQIYNGDGAEATEPGVPS
jgi:hypothetical protein